MFSDLHVLDTEYRDRSALLDVRCILMLHYVVFVFAGVCACTCTYFVPRLRVDLNWMGWTVYLEVSMYVCLSCKIWFRDVFVRLAPKLVLTIFYSVTLLRTRSDGRRPDHIR